MPLATDVYLTCIARTIPCMTGAELANEAVLLAVKRDWDRVTGHDLSDALEKVELGAQRPLVMPGEEGRRAA